MMKKTILLFFTLLLATSICFAQSHLEIKGHPINGSFNAFVRTLVNSGFWQDPVHPDVLYGTYCNKPAVFTIESSAISNTVFRITVDIRPGIKFEQEFKKKWSSLSDKQKLSYVKENSFRIGSTEYKVIQDAEGLSEVGVALFKKAVHSGSSGSQMVGMPGFMESKSLSHDLYYEVKDALTIKYGKPESFESLPKQPRKGKSRITIGSYNITWSSVFTSSAGTIDLSSEFESTDVVRVILTDTQNLLLKEKEDSSQYLKKAQDKAANTRNNSLDL